MDEREANPRASQADRDPTPRAFRIGGVTPPSPRFFRGSVAVVRLFLGGDASVGLWRWGVGKIRGPEAPGGKKSAMRPRSETFLFFGGPTGPGFPRGPNTKDPRTKRPEKRRNHRERPAEINPPNKPTPEPGGYGGGGNLVTALPSAPCWLPVAGQGVPSTGPSLFRTHYAHIRLSLSHD